MGGWRMLLVTLARPERICGPVGLASAPDLIAARRTPNDRARLERDGMLLAPSDYGDPIPITRRLLDDGEEVALSDILTPSPAAASVRAETAGSPAQAKPRGIMP
jgi:hypothetical protein